MDGDHKQQVDGVDADRQTARTLPRVLVRRAPCKRPILHRWVYRAQNRYARFVGIDLEAVLGELCEQTKDRLLVSRARLHCRGGTKGHTYRGWRMSRRPLKAWRPEDEVQARDEGDLTLVLPEDYAALGGVVAAETAQTA